MSEANKEPNRRKLTPSFVLKPDPPGLSKSGKPLDRVIHWDTVVQGFGLQVTRTGHPSYVIQYRIKGRSRRMAAQGRLNDLKEARTWAKGELGKVARGTDPLEERRKDAVAASNTLRAVCEQYLEQLKIAKRNSGPLRTLDQRRAMLERLVYPRQIASRPIDEIRRSEITHLLDHIAKKRGLSMADSALAILRIIMQWHMKRTDDFVSPIIRGMTRTSPKELARDRTLTDDELRAVWKAADTLGTPFTRMLQFILLTGVRRNEAARMDRSEITGDEWLIPSDRVKNKKDFLVPLTAPALAILGKLPVIGDGKRGPVFTTDGKRPLGGFGQPKEDFDKVCGFAGWTIHDLRRTARTLMSRAGVQADIAERALGHTITGVRGVYDRHAFAPEKRQALEALASLIQHILNPESNVVQLRGA
jgi:integrase